MKTILVPIDFSEHSQNALQVASFLAKQHHAKIILFHMIGISESVFAKSELEEEGEVKYYLQLAKKKLKSFLDKSYLQDLRIETIIQNLKDFSEVSTVAQEKHVDLVVMGSHGASTFHAFFVGSNTEKVVRTSHIPVLVIKSKHSSFHIKRILFATDLSPESAYAYGKVKALAKTFHAELPIVHVNTIGANYRSNSKIREDIVSFRALLKEKVDVKVHDDSTVEDGIFNHAMNISADIVALSTRGRKGLAHFFLGSIGENVANTVKLPVLTIRAQLTPKKQL